MNKVDRSQKERGREKNQTTAIKTSQDPTLQIYFLSDFFVCVSLNNRKWANDLFLENTGRSCLNNTGTEFFVQLHVTWHHMCFYTCFSMSLSRFRCHKLQLWNAFKIKCGIHEPSNGRQQESSCAPWLTLELMYSHRHTGTLDPAFLDLLVLTHINWPWLHTQLHLGAMTLSVVSSLSSLWLFWHQKFAPWRLSSQLRVTTVRMLH